MLFGPHQGVLLYLRMGLTLLFGYYNWRTYREACKIVHRPMAFLAYLLWALTEIVVRAVIIFAPDLFAGTGFLEVHWFGLSLTFTVILQAWGSREMYKIISVEMNQEQSL